MAKPSKQFKKFASSGKLKETIQKRRKIQQSKRKFDEKVAQRQKQRGRAEGDDQAGEDEDEDEEDEADGRDLKKAGSGGRAGGVAKTVDELFGGDLAGGGSDDPEEEEDDDDEEDLSEGDDDDDDEEEEEQGEALEADEEAMKKAMEDLEKKDPEFFKYLAENDKELLEFGDDGEGVEDEDMEDEEEDEEMDEDEAAQGEEEEEEEEVKKVVVTGRMLRQWQEGMLRLHSLRSLRSTLLAFRSAAHMNEEESEGAGGTKYAINSPAVFNKLVITALKFTPVVLSHHIPYKTQRDGRIKVSQPKKPNPRLNRLILSHFTTLLHFIRSLPARPVAGEDESEAGGLLLMALGESTKLVPWILIARKHVRSYLKTLLELWSSATDNIRIAAFLAVRKLFVAGDDAIRDICLKSTYRSLLAPLRHTTPHTLPSLNLLKNTSSELFLLSPALSYPHAFTAIRMLAVHLRDCIRDVTAAPSTRSNAQSSEGGPTGKKGGDQQEAFRKVYNWQFVHCIDFWCRTLGSACSREAELERGGVKSELEMLVYPLVQIALGVIRLLPSPRYFPLRFHILHSLLSLCAKTTLYIPLTPYLLEILDSAEFRSSSGGKKTTLKPLDLEYIIRAPQAYPKTRIYQEVIGEELVFLLASFHALYSTHIAFPEIALPAIITIRKHLKKGSAGGGKTASGFKVLVEKLEESRKWVESRRRGVGFAPSDKSEVGKWMDGLDSTKTPIGSWVGTLGKQRERKREEVERALREERD